MHHAKARLDIGHGRRFGAVAASEDVHGEAHARQVARNLRHVDVLPAAVHAARRSKR
jgi:hypothetical protein